MNDEKMKEVTKALYDGYVFGQGAVHIDSNGDIKHVPINRFYKRSFWQKIKDLFRFGSRKDHR